MAVLSIDTARGGIRLGLLRDSSCDDVAGAEILFAYKETVRGQAEFLIPMSQDLCVQGGLSLDQLDLIIFHKGPGSFTGVRIGMIAAQSIALASGADLLAIDGFTLAVKGALLGALQKGGREDFPQDLIFSCIIKSGREELYVQDFSATGQALNEAAMLLPDDITAQLAGYNRVMGLGNACAAFADDFSHGFDCGALGDQPDILNLYQKDKSIFSTDLSPVYLREADVSQPKKKQRVLES